MKAAAPCWQVQHNAWLCADALNDHDLTPDQRLHVSLVHRTHPDDLGWLPVVRMFVMYREVFGERV